MVFRCGVRCPLLAAAWLFSRARAAGQLSEPELFSDEFSSSLVNGLGYDSKQGILYEVGTRLLTAGSHIGTVVCFVRGIEVASGSSTLFLEWDSDGIARSLDGERGPRHSRDVFYSSFMYHVYMRQSRYDVCLGARDDRLSSPFASISLDPRSGRRCAAPSEIAPSKFIVQVANSQFNLGLCHKL